MTIITSLPAAPSRSMNPGQFVTTTDAFIASLPRLVSEINSVAIEIAVNATKSEQASTSAIALAGAEAWVNGNTYAKNSASVSQIDFQTYRKKTASSVTTVDPKDDPTNWALLNPIPGSVAMYMHSNFGGF